MAGYGDSHFKHGKVKGRVVTTDAAPHVVIAAPGKGRKIWISKASISSVDPSVSAEVHLLSAATIIWTHKIPFDGGNEPSWPDPIDCNENEALSVQVSVITAGVTVSVSGYLEVI